LIRALDENLDAFFSVQYPAGERVCASEAIHERAKAHALHYAANFDGTSTGHDFYSRFTMQPRPCQPI